MNQADINEMLVLATGAAESMRRLISERDQWKARAEQAEAKVATLQERTQRHERAKNLGQAVEADAATMNALRERAEKAEREGWPSRDVLRRLDDLCTVLEQAIASVQRDGGVRRDEAIAFLRKRTFDIDDIRGAIGAVGKVEE